ncbi:hypothetical protein FXO38_32400 [Capsicum annuum]|nr:hypothetical protein FXO38_32400 [Capsicum annuum]
MALKGDSSTKKIPKKNTKKKRTPKSGYQLRNEETNESNSDLVEYPLKGKADPREKQPRKKNSHRRGQTFKRGENEKSKKFPPHLPLSSDEDNKYDDDEKIDDGDGNKESSPYEVDSESEE